jgi:hypothetical protein
MTYEYPDAVVGLPYHSFASVAHEINVGDELVLERQPSNEHDSNAIAVYLKKSVMIFFSEKVMLGFLPSDKAAKYAPMMDAGANLCGVVHTSDWNRGESPKLRIFIK